MAQSSVFRWSGLASTNFATAGNWYNITAGEAASVAPGVNDEALISTTGSITGYGNVFELVMSGASVAGTLQGDLVYAVGVTIAPNGLLQAGDLLEIGEGSGNPLVAAGDENMNLDGGSEVDVVPVDANAAGLVVAGSGDNATLSLTEQGGHGSRLLTYSDDGSTVLTVGSAGRGVVNVSGSASSLGAFGTSLIGTGIGGSGTVAVDDGGRVVLGADAISGGLTLGIGGGNGILSFAGASQGLLQGQVVVGASGVSNLSVMGGLSVTGGSGLVVQSSNGAGMLIGEFASGTGSVLVSDPYSFASVSGGLEVGRFGAGTLVVQNQARVVSDDTPSLTTPALSIGGATGGNGAVSVLSQSEFIALGAGIAVGNLGSGQLDVTGGIVTVTTAPSVGVSALDAGVLAGSQGVVSVGGGGVISDTQAAGMIIGDAGSGTMAIGGASDALGGLVLTGDPTAAAGYSLGVASGGDGTIAISGSASGLAVYGAVADGVSGDGSIAVTDGGHLVADIGTLTNGLVLGVESGGTGTMSVDSGAQVYVVGYSVIGDAGAGSLSITGGSSFTGVSDVGTIYSSHPYYLGPLPAGLNSALTVGLAATGVGDVLISGPSTYVPISGGLVVGEAGQGSLSVTDSAVLAVSSDTAKVATNVVLGGAQTGSGTLSLSDQAQLIETSGIEVGYFGHGELDVSNATLTIIASASNNAITVASGPFGNGITPSGVINVAGGVIEDLSASGIQVGESGSGTLAISQVGNEGGVVLTTTLIIGSFGTGLVSVSGSASALAAYVGTSLDGTLMLESGSRFATGNSLESTGLVASGLMSLAGASAADVLGETQIYANITLSITGGSGFTGTTDGSPFAPDALSLYGGDVLVSDSLSYMNLTGQLAIGGYGGSASMSVANGALVAVTAAGTTGVGVSIDNDRFDTAGDRLVVDGAGSRLVDTGFFDVGGSQNSGLAEMVISAGGTVTVAQAAGQSGPVAMIGNLNGVQGAASEVTVTGATSDWSIAGTLEIAGNVSGSATLDVGDGGQVNAGLVLLNDAVDGVITVEGAGSVLNATTVLVGGNSVGGTLAVNAGGVIDASNGIGLSGTALLAGGTLMTATTLNLSVGSEVTGVSGSSAVSAGAIVDLGNIVASDGTLSCLGTITGSGLITVAGGVLVLGNSEAAGVAIDYSAAGGGLVAQSAADIAGTVSGWGAGDFIGLTGVTATSESYANGTLSLFGASSELVGTLHFAGSLTTSNFTLSTLAGGGTEIGYHS